MSGPCLDLNLDKLAWKKFFEKMGEIQGLTIRLEKVLVIVMLLGVIKLCLCKKIYTFVRDAYINT